MNTRRALALLCAERDALAATLHASGGDAASAQRSATTLIVRWLFLRQLQAWRRLPDDADLAALAQGTSSPFSDLFDAQLLTLSSCHLVILSSCHLISSSLPASDLIGALVERLGDQRQLGAYYTSADVTGYIAAQCIVPALLDALAARCPAQLAACWPLLSHNPDRYIPAAVRHGCAAPLPADVQRGAADVAARTAWDRAAPPAHALPGETWREVVTRRTRYADLHRRLAGGAVCAPNALITFNLDAQQFALDVIETCADAALHAACWDALTTLTVLDPTCGSGAFLLAALALLRPLYAACARRLPQPPPDAEIVRTISAHNLYGVDIVGAAAEACRLRLYLAYAAAAESDTQLAPLPELRRHVVVANILDRSQKSEVRSQKSEVRSQKSEVRSQKSEVRSQKSEVRSQKSEVRSQKSEVRSQALAPHAASLRAFDVVLGNPPYLATSKAPYRVQGYATERCGNLYALIVERALELLRPGGRLGMIVPIASVSTEAMRPLVRLYDGLGQWHSHYAVRPSRLFADVDMNLTITLLHNARAAAQCFVTGYRRWSSGAQRERPHLFDTLSYTENPRFAEHANPLPKLDSPLEARILAKMLAHGYKLRDYVIGEGVSIYYHSGGRYWRKALLERRSSHYKPVIVPHSVAPLVFCLLNSQLFYWYWISNSNCMDVVAREVRDLPVFALDSAAMQPFSALMRCLLAAYAQSSTVRVRRGAQIHVAEINVDVGASKPIIDSIDHQLAAYYGFTDEELDFIVHYDIKYRIK